MSGMGRQTAHNSRSLYRFQCKTYIDKRCKTLGGTIPLYNRLVTRITCSNNFKLLETPKNLMPTLSWKHDKSTLVNSQERNILSIGQSAAKPLNTLCMGKVQRLDGVGD